MCVPAQKDQMKPCYSCEHRGLRVMQMSWAMEEFPFSPVPDNIQCQQYSPQAAWK